MSNLFAHEFQPATVLQASGEDVFSFLQGQFSNDLRPAGEGRVTYGLWLSAKGKVVGDAFAIQRAGGRFLLVSPYCPADAMRARLESFVIADDVALEDVTGQWSGIAVWGAGAARSAAILGIEAPAGGRAHGACGIAGFASHRWGTPAIEWLFDRTGGGAASFKERLVADGFVFLDPSSAERERILHGGVAVPAELGPGDLPQEAGVEGIAVSFTKGCFIGQEVMARLKSMGRVRRGLIRVRGEGAPPAVPTALFAGDRNVGEIRSIAALESGGFVGRAMVSRTDLPEALSIGSGAQARSVRTDTG